MKFSSTDRADVSQVEDRRGGRFPGGLAGAGGGLGLVGLLIVGIVRLLGGNVETTGPDESSDRAPTQASPGANANTAPALSGSCEGVRSTSDPAKFVVCVETNVQNFWARELPKHEQAYAPAKLVLFSDGTRSGCGVASAATGPFYCPLDQKVYLDTSFFGELEQRFHARGGDFAQAYIVAHEYGHHVQRLVGIEQRVHAAQERHPREANALSVRLELQADCLSGVWGHSAYDSGKVESSEIAQALDAAAAVGDDRIQKQTSGRIRTESFTHGSADERQRAFRRGFDSGRFADCERLTSEI